MSAICTTSPVTCFSEVMLLCSLLSGLSDQPYFAKEQGQVATYNIIFMEVYRGVLLGLNIDFPTAQCLTNLIDFILLKVFF